MAEGDAAELLRRGAEALGCPLDASQADRLLAFLVLMRRWGRVYNLTALSGSRELVTHHLLDSLAVVPSLRRQTRGRPFRLLDVGSGAGLPGLVVAAVLDSAQVTCVDAAAKKSAFIRQASIELGLTGVAVVHDRVERMPGFFDVIVSRAFASLADFTMLTEPRLAGGGVWMAMKARVADEEMTAAGAGEVFHVEQITVPYLDAARCLVWLRRR